LARRVAAGGQMPTASPGGLAVLALAADAHPLAGARQGSVPRDFRPYLRACCRWRTGACTKELARGWIHG